MNDLVKKAQRGNDEAFYELIIRNKARLYGTAMQYLKSEAMALEAVQEVTCRAYMQIKKLKDPVYFSTWVIRIMINYCLDELRRSKRFVDLEGWEIPDDKSMDERIVCMDLKQCINRLQPRYRDVLILRYYEDMSIKDISETLKKPEGTIKTWINRGLAQLRNLMKGSEVYVSR